MHSTLDIHNFTIHNTLDDVAMNEGQTIWVKTNNNKYVQARESTALWLRPANNDPARILEN